MIDHDKLKGMLQAEVETATAWKNMTDKERRAYVKAHPKSKYAKSGTLSPSVSQGTTKVLKDHGLSHVLRSSKSKVRDYYRSGTDKNHYSLVNSLKGMGYKKGKSSESKVDEYHHESGNQVNIDRTGGGYKYQVSHHFPKREGTIKDVGQSPNPKPGTAMPTGTNATKASNHLIKHYGAKRLRKIPGENNPYSEDHLHDHKMDPGKADALVSHLKSQGWNHSSKEGEDVSKWTKHDLTHPDGGHVNVYSSDGSNTISNKPYARVRTWGKKKAKKSTIPYYD